MSSNVFGGQKHVHTFFDFEPFKQMYGGAYDSGRGDAVVALNHTLIRVRRQTLHVLLHPAQHEQQIFRTVRSFADGRPIRIVQLIDQLLSVNAELSLHKKVCVLLFAHQFDFELAECERNVEFGRPILFRFCQFKVRFRSSKNVLNLESMGGLILVHLLTTSANETLLSKTTVSTSQLFIISQNWPRYSFNGTSVTMNAFFVLKLCKNFKLTKIIVFSQTEFK